jgi:hypothetical protein
MPAGDSVPALFMRTQSGREIKTAAGRIVGHPIIVSSLKGPARHKLDGRSVFVEDLQREISIRR